MAARLFLWECVIVFFEILLFSVFIQDKLRAKNSMRHMRIKQSVFLLCLFFLLCTLIYMGISSLTVMSVLSLFGIAFAFLFYNESLITRLFWSSMYFVLCLFSLCIILFVPLTFSELPVTEIHASGTLYITFSSLYLILVAAFVFSCRKISGQKMQLSSMQNVSFILIPNVVIFVGYFIVKKILKPDTAYYSFGFSFQTIIRNPFFLVVLLFFVLYVYEFGYTAALHSALLDQKRIHELEKMEYETLIHTTESLREMKHDIEIHLDVIHSLSENGELSELQSYIDAFHLQLAHTHNLISTGNTAIDCILSNKLALARELNIETDFSVLIPAVFPLDPLSLSSLLGNMWNNALEACRRLQKNHPEIQPYIHFYIKPFQHMTIIHMENNYDQIIRENNRYISLKTGSLHGIGLKRITDIVSNAEGILQITSENNVFVIHIMIPQKEEAHEALNCHS